MIGRADTFDDVARRTEIGEWREPAIEERLGLRIPFHVEAQRPATARIVIQIHSQLISRGRRRVVLRDVGTSAE